MLGWILFGLLVGGTIAVLTVTVKEFILRSNLADIIRQKFRNTQNEMAKKMLGHMIKLKIKSKGVNVVSLDAIDEDTGDIIEINITSESGVSDSIQINDVVSICA